MARPEPKPELISPPLDSGPQMNQSSVLSRPPAPPHGAGIRRRSASVGPPSRKRKTHLTEQISSLLRRLPKSAKLEQNRQIEERNLHRELKHARHVAAPRRYPDDASDCSSLITIEDAERPSRSPPAPPSITEVPLPIKRARDTDDDEVEKEVLPKRRRLLSLVQEEPMRQPGEPIKYPFHYVLHHLAQHNIYMPLSLFTFRNISNISRQVYSLKYRRLYGGIVGPGEDSGSEFDNDEIPRILDVNNFQNQFGFEEQLHPAQWFQAAQNYIEFMALRDSIDGQNGSAGKRWEDHFNFFRRQEDIAEKFEAIKEVDIKLRQLYVAGPFTYDPAYYDAELQTAIIRRDFDCDGPAQVHVASPSRQSIHSEHSLTSRMETASASGSTGNALSTSSRRQRNRRTRQDRSPAVCLVCARRGHYFSSCHCSTFENGQPTYVEPDGNSDIVTVDERRVLCRIWNVGGDRVVCFHNQSTRAHICSFCGDHRHHVFSWTCRAAP